MSDSRGSSRILCYNNAFVHVLSSTNKRRLSAVITREQPWQQRRRDRTVWKRRIKTCPPKGEVMKIMRDVLGEPFGSVGPEVGIHSSSLEEVPRASKRQTLRRIGHSCADTTDLLSLTSKQQQRDTRSIPFVVTGTFCCRARIVYVSRILVEPLGPFQLGPQRSVEKGSIHDRSDWRSHRARKSLHL